MSELKDPIASASGNDEKSATALPVWPMILGVAVAGAILNFLCSWLPRGKFSIEGLIFLCTSLLFTAVVVSGFVTRTIYRKVFPEVRRVSTSVVRAACLSALWVPAWVLFAQTWSLLMVLAACLCLASVGIFLKQCSVENGISGEGSKAARLPGEPFQFEGTPLGRVLLPSLALALLAEAAIALMAARRYPMASFVLGVVVAILGWRAVSKLSAGTTRAPVLSSQRQVAMVSAAFVLTAMALLPFLRIKPLWGGLIPKLRGSNASLHGGEGRLKEQFSSSDGYSGIILLSPSVPQKRILVPVRHDVTDYSVKLAQPMEIPFDGAYWYFKAPDKAPRPTARVVRASSLKATIRSSDYYPLLMEAHQKLSDSIDLGCCSAIGLVVQNGDRREGAISLELWVRKRVDAKSPGRTRWNAVAPENAPHYLGAMTIPSSEHPPVPAGEKALPPEEKLVFPVPAAMEGIRFDEISVVVRTSPARARMGAKIAIRKFVLQP